jgi:hypothetical protein
MRWLLRTEVHKMTPPRLSRWYHCGLAGAGLFAIGTLVHFLLFLLGIPHSPNGDNLTRAEMAKGLLKALVFAMALGFACGVVVALLSRLLYRVALPLCMAIGAVGAPAVLVACFWIAAPAGLTDFWTERPWWAIALCLLLAVLGGVLGAVLHSGYTDDGAQEAKRD